MMPFLHKVGLSVEDLSVNTQVKWNSKELDDDDCAMIGELALRGALENLVKLDVSYNSIGGQGMHALVGSLHNGALRSLKFLILDRNRIGDEGIVRLDRSID